MQGEGGDGSEDGEGSQDEQSGQDAAEHDAVLARLTIEQALHRRDPWRERREREARGPAEVPTISISPEPKS